MRIRKYPLEKQQFGRVTSKLITRNSVRKNVKRKQKKVENPHLTLSHHGNHITRFSKLVPNFVESDRDAFFLQFEDLAAGMKWEKCVWAILIHTAVFGNAATVIAAMSQENKFDYDEVKSVILKAYELIPDAYCQKFRKKLC